LARAGAALSLSELARRAQLQPSSVRRPIARLASHGIVELIGIGPRKLIQWRGAHPLASTIGALFAAERARVERLKSGLTHLVSSLGPYVVAAWLEERAPHRGQDVGAPLVLRVLLQDGYPLDAADQLRNGVVHLEQAEELTVEIDLLSRADLAATTAERRAALVAGIHLYGVSPGALVNPRAGQAARVTSASHADQDARSLALACAIVRKLAADPGLVTRTHEQLILRMREASASERHTLQEWAQVLESMPGPRLLRFLVDGGERAIRLRQSLPFHGILTEEERSAALTGHGE
jgi:hypothetical protein